MLTSTDIPELTLERLSEDMQEMRNNFKTIMEMMKGFHTSTSTEHQESHGEIPVTPPLQEMEVDNTPFKLEARIDIPMYDGELNPEKLDGRLKSLEVYFSTKGYTES